MFHYLFDDAGVLSGPVTLFVTPGLGVQLPSNAVELPDELTEPENGFVWAWVNGAPQALRDRRGVVFQTQTGTSTNWEQLGELPDGFTDKPWPGQYYVWLDGDWQLDQSAKGAAELASVQEARDNRLREAAMRIAPLQYAVELGDATQQEQSALLDWKRYCVALNRIEQQAGYPLEVEWPILTFSEPKEPANSLLSLFRTKQK
ncbi:tail fiber assembly protein [Pseudomonas sp. 6D_7.1_Bac1]|uniref:tail fiber assembly protein n=1 Tax=Pseudomonas sp. 6D_7.1_Bac1 TaxID=2971615 RepID=UPI0021C86210|nr:tail fiber assembly protein [Pseudomonas sp. 6D_7.1_Bac1]MCU1750437.1 tail fiber assembly protein [Pseudomonas sp. 6D_7.1_Bac1]